MYEGLEWRNGKLWSGKMDERRINKQTKPELLRSQAWWRTPVVPALRRQKQKTQQEFEANLVYHASYRQVKAT